HYEARIDERVNLVSDQDEPVRQFWPDVAVVQREAPGEGGGAATAAVLTADEPVSVPLVYLNEERGAYIEILHRPDRSLVTAIELLSPANKVGAGRVAYLARRNVLLWQPIHLVELDFLLGGARLPMRRELPPGDYYAFVARGDRRPDCGVHA